MMFASASFGLTWENYREDNLFYPKYIMIVTWKFSFPEMTFSGPDCNSGDWDPSGSFPPITDSEGVISDSVDYDVQRDW